MNASTTTLTHGVGTQGVAVAAAKHLSHWGRTLWQGMNRLGQRRAAAQLRRLSMGYEATNPALASQMRQMAAEYEGATS